MNMTHTKDDPALRSPEQRDAIAAATTERKHDACTRRTCTVAEAVSMEALEHQYPQVLRMREENDRLRDAAGEVVADVDTIACKVAIFDAMRGRLLMEAAEKLRAAMGGK